MLLSFSDSQGYYNIAIAEALLGQRFENIDLNRPYPLSDPQTPGEALSGMTLRLFMEEDYGIPVLDFATHDDPPLPTTPTARLLQIPALLRTVPFLPNHLIDQVQADIRDKLISDKINPDRPLPP